MGSNWLAGPGQWWILFSSWSVISLFYLSTAWRMGKSVGSETDGCLLMICNMLFVVIGAMVGLTVLRFPYNLLSSMFLALTLPTCITLTWHRRSRTRKRP